MWHYIDGEYMLIHPSVSLAGQTQTALADNLVGKLNNALEPLGFNGKVCMCSQQQLRQIPPPTWTGTRFHVSPIPCNWQSQMTLYIAHFIMGKNPGVFVFS